MKIKVYKRGWIRNKLVAEFCASKYNLVTSTEGVLTIRRHYRDLARQSVLVLSPSEWSFAYITPPDGKIKFNVLYN